MRKYIIFLMCLSLLLCGTAMVYAQPEDEEEEEPVQAMPNPMDSTIKTGMPIDPYGTTASSKADQLSVNGHDWDHEVGAEIQGKAKIKKQLSKMQSMQDKMMEQSSNRMERGRATRERTTTRDIPAGRKP